MNSGNQTEDVGWLGDILRINHKPGSCDKTILLYDFKIGKTSVFFSWCFAPVDRAILKRTANESKNCREQQNISHLISSKLCELEKHRPITENIVLNERPNWSF